MAIPLFPVYEQINGESRVHAHPVLKLSDAERDAEVTPVNYAYPPQHLWRYGSDPTGVTSSQTAFDALIAVMRKAVNHSGYIPGGTYKITSLNCADNYAQTGGTPDFNNGLTLTGDGMHTTTVLFSPGTDNVAGTVGLDLTGVAYFSIRDMSFGDAGATNCPQVTVLLAKGFRGAVVFSGNGSFSRCLVGANGSFGMYVQGAEVVDFNDCEFIGGQTRTIPAVISRANSAGVTSPNATLNSPADSMTAVSFTGYQSAAVSVGAACVLLDEATLGIASIDFGQMYFPCIGSNTVAILDSGGAGSSLDGITASSLHVEGNGGGANQIMLISAQNIRKFNVNATFATGATQTAALCQFGNPIYTSHLMIDYSTGGTPVCISAPQAWGCIFQSSGLVGSISISGGGNYIPMGTDHIRPSLSATAFGETIAIAPGTSNATYYSQAVLNGGVRSSAFTDGGLARQTTSGVANSVAVIYSTSSFGELVIVTGVGSGAIFQDLVFAAYNAFTVVSSMTAQGAPAARTYSVNNDGTLRLTMGSATAMSIVVQSLKAGAQL